VLLLHGRPEVSLAKCPAFFLLLLGLVGLLRVGGWRLLYLLWRYRLLHLLYLQIFVL
jgi:hypothetical protein